jgi:hypothetical protein
MDWGTSATIIGTLTAIVLPPVRSLVKTAYKVKEDLSAHEAADSEYQRSIDTQLKDIKAGQDVILTHLLSGKR